jgi:hypothetical protein
MSRVRDSRTTTKWTSWLTARRLRVHGVILAVCLWVSCGWIFCSPGLIGRNGVVKGADFLHYYTLSWLAREHRGADLYDMAAQSTLAQQRVPSAGHLFFVPLYGPQVSLFFTPLSVLPYAWALLIWELLNGTIYAWCCYAVWRTCPNLRSEGLTVLLLGLAYPALFHLIAWGQTSAIALACFTVAYFELRAKRFFFAGLAIGCLVFKPQLGLAAACVFLVSREWKVVVGAVAAALAQLSVGWFYYGTSVMRDYLQHLTRVRDVFLQLEPRPYQMHSLRSFWAMVVPWPEVALGLYVATAIAVLIVALLCWKSDAPLGVRFSGLLLATVLVSPHLTVYDLVILAPAFLLLADWAVASDTSYKGSVGLLLYLCYGLPLVGPLSSWTHLQLSVPAMVASLWTIFRLSAEAGGAGSEQARVAT